MASSTILGQARGTTSLASIYSPGTGKRGRVATIIVANTSGAGATFQICLDEDGTTYDETTTIAWNVPCNSGQVIHLDYGTYDDGALPLNDTSANLAVKSSVTSAITFTVIGQEI